MTFYSGQKVVCIDAGPCPVLRIPSNLVRGRVYTVLSTYLYQGDKQALHLIEVQPPSIAVAGYAAFLFRPAVSRPTSISIFTAMLGPKVKDPANV